MGIPIPGTTNVVYHNVVYVATSGDIVYAFDADNNGGINAAPSLASHSLTTNPQPGLTPYSIRGSSVGTPVIDPSSNTIYLVSSRDHAQLHGHLTACMRSISRPARKSSAVPFRLGFGAGHRRRKRRRRSDLRPLCQLQRPGLLLLNGVLYIAFGSIDDNGPWHGWLFSYNATTLAQIDVFCTTANGRGAGIWMGGSGLAAEVNDPAKPYGRMFVATGNGTYTASHLTPIDELRNEHAGSGPDWRGDDR